MTESGLALLHARFGIFRYSEVLNSKGITAPSRQICAVAWILESWLADQPNTPPPSGDSSSCCWIEAQVLAASQMLPNDLKLEPLKTLQLRVGDRYRWNVCEDFAELLHFRCGPPVYKRVTARLANWSPATVCDIQCLIDHFVMHRCHEKRLCRRAEYAGFRFAEEDSNGA